MEPIGRHGVPHKHFHARQIPVRSTLQPLSPVAHDKLAQRQDREHDILFAQKSSFAHGCGFDSNFRI